MLNVKRENPFKVYCVIFKLIYFILFDLFVIFHFQDITVQIASMIITSVCRILANMMVYASISLTDTNVNVPKCTQDGIALLRYVDFDGLCCSRYNYRNGIYHS